MYSFCRPRSDNQFPPKNVTDKYSPMPLPWPFKNRNEGAINSITKMTQ